MSVRTSRLRRGVPALSWTDAVRQHSQPDPSLLPGLQRAAKDMPAYRNYVTERRKSLRGSLEAMGALTPHHQGEPLTGEPESPRVTEGGANPYMYDFNKSMQQQWEAGARQGHRGSLTTRMLDMANNAPCGLGGAGRRRNQRFVPPLSRQASDKQTSQTEGLRAISELGEDPGSARGLMGGKGKPSPRPSPPSTTGTAISRKKLVSDIIYKRRGNMRPASFCGQLISSSSLMYKVVVN